MREAMSACGLIVIAALGRAVVAAEASGSTTATRR
jgi:hypothetical protein